MKKEIEHEFRIEIFITILFAVIALIAVQKIGFNGAKEFIFTTITLIEVPFVYIGCKIARKLTYEIIRDMRK